MESAAATWREDRKRSRDDNDLGARDGLLMRQSIHARTHSLVCARYTVMKLKVECAILHEQHRTMRVAQ